MRAEENPIRFIHSLSLVAKLDAYEQLKVYDSVQRNITERPLHLCPYVGNFSFARN